VKIQPSVVHPDQVQQFSSSFGQKLTDVPVNDSLPSPEEIQDELIYYCNVLLGREAPPIESPYMDLCEIASAYFARACELEIMIYWEEQHQRVMRGHPLYKIRTGQLRTFMDMAKRMADLGSRRLTQEQLLYEQKYDEGGAMH
jgi:hypothetical protein